MLGILVDISTVLSGFKSLLFLEYGDVLLPFVPERGSTAQSTVTCSSAGYACPAHDRQSTEIMRGDSVPVNRGKSLTCIPIVLVNDALVEEYSWGRDKDSINLHGVFFCFFVFFTWNTSVNYFGL